MRCAIIFACAYQWPRHNRSLKSVPKRLASVNSPRIKQIPLLLDSLFRHRLDVAKRLINNTPHPEGWNLYSTCMVCPHRKKGQASKLKWFLFRRPESERSIYNFIRTKSSVVVGVLVLRPPYSCQRGFTTYRTIHVWYEHIRLDTIGTAGREGIPFIVFDITNIRP